MSATFVQKGESIDFRPASDTPAGTVVVQGELVGVVQRDITANTLGSLAVDGVFDFSKATGSGTGFAAGVKAYWDDTAKVATEDAAGGVNKYLGKTAAEASDDAAAVRVRLDQ
jgi:predicted RecA/RadA family phage recombinase